MSTVYLLHFDSPLYHAQHYLGITSDLPSRIERHLHSNGSPLIAAALRAGITPTLARTWEGDRTLERQLKRSHNNRRFCPICSAQKET